MKEVWKDIPNCNGKYQVSNCGNIKINDYRNSGIPKVTKGSLAPNGYMVISINKKSKLVHRLVAEAFIANPDRLPLLNHKDEVKTNNTVSNLEWCDYRYNLMYGGHNRNVAVLAITGNGEVEHYKSITEASKKLKVTRSAISQALHRKTSQCRGRLWFFSKSPERR